MPQQHICAECGHQHAHPILGGICIGCPCTAVCECGWTGSWFVAGARAVDEGTEHSQRARWSPEMQRVMAAGTLPGPIVRDPRA